VLQEDRLTRIEEKIDKISDSVSSLAKSSAVMSTKITELQVRREESHQRANKFSERMDHMHDGIHDLDTHLKGLESKVTVTSKILLGIGSILVAAVINEIVRIL